MEANYRITLRGLEGILGTLCRLLMRVAALRIGSCMYAYEVARALEICVGSTANSRSVLRRILSALVSNYAERTTFYDCILREGANVLKGSTRGLSIGVICFLRFFSVVVFCFGMFFCAE